MIGTAFARRTSRGVSLGFSGILALFPARSARQQPGDLASHPVGAWGIDLGDQDQSIRPGDNFYMYQNGAWFNRTVLGPGLQASAYWRDLRLLAPKRLSAILQSLSADGAPSHGSREGKAAAFFRAFMDSAAVEAKGLEPLRPELDAIRGAGTRSELAALLGRIAGPGTVRLPPSSAAPPGIVPFLVAIVPDQRNPSRHAVALGQGGLLLPGPEFYLEPQFADVRVAFTGYAARMLSLIGWPEPERRAREILELETRIARASWSHERMLDAAATWNPMTVSELVRFAPGFDWRRFLIGAELGGVTQVAVDARSAFPGIAAALAVTPLEVLQVRQALAAVDARAGELNNAVRTVNAEFRSRNFGGGALFGSDRALRAEKASETALGDALAALYVARYSPPELKARVEEMSGRLKQAFDRGITNAAWLSPAGRAAARTKLARMRVKIGFPDCFDDFRGLEINEHDLYGNVQRSAAYAWRRQVKQLGRPVDRSSWSLAPEYPNYNYVATTNTVEIPAALLVPPFFDPNADAAVNYGALGALIGQMMVTGFTSQGVGYDGEGRYAPWLSPADSAALAERRNRLSAQYSAVTPLPGMHLKGALLVDEAVGDLGGLEIALDAWRASLGGSAAPVLDGFTGEQRFFLGRAQMWRAKFGQAFVRNQIATGANAPPFMRVNGPLPNMDRWYEAFGVATDAAMYVAPAERVRIW